MEERDYMFNFLKYKNNNNWATFALIFFSLNIIKMIQFLSLGMDYEINFANYKQENIVMEQFCQQILCR